LLIRRQKIIQIKMAHIPITIYCNVYQRARNGAGC
jgi:hypothetical protein